VKKLSAIILNLGFFILSSSALAQPDAANCQDHPLFPTRMPNYRIETCKTQDFGTYDFYQAKGPKLAVEGKFTTITYAFTGTRANEPSGTEIVRNYENAIKKIGGIIVQTDPQRLVTAKISQDGMEAWVEVMKGNGKIWLKIVEKKSMTQRIEASAEIFSNNIKTTGHAAVYGINFDSGSAVIKPESGSIIAEIAKLLKTDMTLRIFVVGHTDNTGTVENNVKLSQDRALAVTQELVQKNGIAPVRLKAFGCGQFAPVASNDTEEGKAKNRRVELVKQ
jgi:OmpA-OmpF porin, OOP family